LDSESQENLCMPQYSGTDILEIEKVHSIDREKLLLLCGGIPIEEEFPLQCDIKKLDDFIVEVEIESAIFECTRKIDFEFNEMTNIRLEVFGKDQGIGTKLFERQLITARQLGIKRILVQAAGRDLDPEFNGHYTWGRFGFTMEEYSKAGFLKWQKENDCFAITLYEMLKKEKCKQKWKKSGITWAGFFNTDQSSINSQRFKEYLELKRAH